jgi:acyl-CoA dehydrogenase
MGTLRKNLLTKPIFKWAKSALPSISETERAALDAGDVWWDAELFTGNPDWSKLLQTPAPKLSVEEQAFIDGPVTQLCHMLDDWKINWELKDLPPEVWDFIKKNKFFAIIIPKKFGGLEFSAFAHSEIVRKIASRSVVAAVTVMVPNSLGPGELLMHFGTDEQRNYWLPRLSASTEIPCFGLTSPEAGSDAAAMIDRGNVCKGTYEGKEVLGIRVSWHKRYTTLGPIATVLGLAFKLYDPDHLLGAKEDIGITVALVPTHLQGIQIGRRHLPAYQMFQNGPSIGTDVFIPMSLVIGGEKMVGQGWQMLMTALAAGRGISLPSLSAAACAFSARTSGAYAGVRRQFNLSIGKFEGIEEPLGRMAGRTYLLDAGRHLTCAGLDSGHKPAVIAAIMKSHATDMMRISINDAMDIHGGKAVMDGPSNYLGGLYRAIPIGITVEGANIMTRNLMIFGQGAIRCHPWLLKEMNALGEPDQAKALQDFDTSFWGHVGHSIKTFGRAWLRSWTGGICSPAPSSVPDKVRPYYKQLSRYAASFALLSDLAFLSLGKDLKRKEMISARLGDIFSQLFLLSAVLKRWEDEGRQENDLPLVKYCMESGFTAIVDTFDAILRNLPSRFCAVLVRFITRPFGSCQHPPSDRLVKACAAILLSPSEQRDRLTAGLYLGENNDALAHLENAFELAVKAEPLRAKARKETLTPAELDIIKTADASFAPVIAVDDFSNEQLFPHKAA